MGTIAWVEDDPTIRKLVRAALRSSPHTVHFATNGREGLELVLRVRLEGVALDGKAAPGGEMRKYLGTDSALLDVTID